MINYEYYSDINELKAVFEEISENIQCIVSENAEITHLRLGQTQCPTPWDYADGVDTMQWAIESI